jgi:type IV secretion system protein VirB10
MGAGQYGEYSAPNVNPQTGVPDPTASVIPQSYTPPNTTPNAAGINAAAIVQQAIQSEQQAAGSPMIVSGTTSSVTETAAASQKIGGLAPGETASANTQSYWLWEGDEIPAQLDTKIVSDLCRVVVAHVTKPGVFDSKTGSHLLIPAFSRITGQCSGTPQQGASREGIDWKTITLPNGNTIDVSGLSASDTSGATGLSAQVDAHSVSTFRQTLLQSIFQRLASIGQNESVVVNAGTTAVPQQAVIPPTLTVPAGTPLTIIVDRRLQIKEYDGDRGSP